MCICATRINVFEESTDVLRRCEVTNVYFNGAFVSCCVECYRMQSCTSNCTSSVCLCVRVFGLSSFKTWSQNQVMRAPASKNRTRLCQHRGKRGESSRIQGTSCHIRLVLHFIWKKYTFLFDSFSREPLNTRKQASQVERYVV